MRNRSRTRSVVTVGLVVAGVALVALPFVPSLRRYARMRRM